MLARLLLLFVPTLPLFSAAPALVTQLRIRILSTMLTDSKGVGEWGFAALVETPSKRILFDTGARPETVLRNADELNVSFAGIDDVILSHNHGDHTGGLVTLRRKHAPALSRAYVAPEIFDSRPAPGGQERNFALTSRPAYEELGGKYVIVGKPTQIAPGIWLTGPVPRKFPERNYPQGMKRKTAAGLVDDDIAEDMSMVIETPRGLIVLTGCGHAGIVNILTHARESLRNAPVYAVIGGLHLFDLSDEKLDWTAGQLRTFGIQHFLGAHCTGVEATMHLRRRLGLTRATAPVGAVGASFDLETGIHPGAIAR